MNLAARLAAADKALAKAAAAPRQVTPGKWAGDPIGYIRNELGGDPWGKQEEICRLLETPPYKVLVEAAHSTGKTWLAAALASYHFDSFETGWTITTAPTHRDVADLLWNEIRIQRNRAGLGGFRGDHATELWGGPEHYAKGFTAAKGESFQGRHPERLFFLFDEATGIRSIFWETTKSMFKSSGKHRWLAILNPTDTSSQAHAERHKVDANGNPAWHIVQMSTLDHPNLSRQLDGKSVQCPGAVDLEQFETWLADWSDQVEAEDITQETDLQWPPEWWRQKHTPQAMPRWWRPGPLMEGRALGRYPSAATYGVWSDRVWKKALVANLIEPAQSILPEIGCDVALMGDDYTAIHVRWGNRSLHHERHNGWDYEQTAERLKALCARYADFINGKRPPQAKPVAPEDIPVKIDADAYGAAVVQLRDGYNFIGVAGSSAARRGDEYFNRRSELWFTTVRRAKKGELDLSRLPQEHLLRIRQQCFAPQWFPDYAGRHQVELKVLTKKRLGCSPDDADALNLAYADAQRMPVATGVDTPKTTRREDRDNRPRQSPHGLFGGRG